MAISSRSLLVSQLFQNIWVRCGNFDIFHVQAITCGHSKCAAVWLYTPYTMTIYIEDMDIKVSSMSMTMTKTLSNK